MPEISPAQAHVQLRRHHFAHIHPSLTAERVAEAVERELTTLDNPGFCLACGAEADGCEPDAEQYRAKAAANVPCTAPPKSSSPSRDLAVRNRARRVRALFYWGMAAPAE